MLVKCIKYYDVHDQESQTSSSVEKGVLYPVLAISTHTNSNEIYYFIQSTTFEEYTPHWANARQFEIIDSACYSAWGVEITDLDDTRIMNLTPREWIRNEDWFFEELSDETIRAVELFNQERDKICDEMSDLLQER